MEASPARGCLGGGGGGAWPRRGWFGGKPSPVHTTWATSSPQRTTFFGEPGGGETLPGERGRLGLEGTGSNGGSSVHGTEDEPRDPLPSGEGPRYETGEPRARGEGPPREEARSDQGVPIAPVSREPGEWCSKAPKRAQTAVASSSTRRRMEIPGPDSPEEERGTVTRGAKGFSGGISRSGPKVLQDAPGEKGPAWQGGDASPSQCVGLSPGERLPGEAGRRIESVEGCLAAMEADSVKLVLEYDAPRPGELLASSRGIEVGPWLPSSFIVVV